MREEGMEEHHFRIDCIRVSVCLLRRESAFTKEGELCTWNTSEKSQK
jgi:hypothetical protein